MCIPTSCCSPDEIERNANCLLDRLAEVRAVLRRSFSENAIEQSVTGVYRAAMAYVTGRRICPIKNWRAWIFKVAIRAASRAAKREVRCLTLEPAIVAAPPEDEEERPALFDTDQVLGQLTRHQRQAVELCILEGKSCREAAMCMGISAGTLCRHLKAGRLRLKVILAPYGPNADRNNPECVRERACFITDVARRGA